MVPWKDQKIMEMQRSLWWWAVPALVTSVLVPSVGMADSSGHAPAITLSTTAAAESGAPAGAPPGSTASTEMSLPPLRLTPPVLGPRYGLSAAPLLAGGIQLDSGRKKLPVSVRRQRLGMTGETEILVWSTGIGAVIGLATGLREDENAIESTLKGAAMGFILPIALFAAMASTVPRAVPVSPVQPTGLTTDAVSSSRLQDNAPPLLHLRLSGQRARGQADRYVALGVGSGVQLSYVRGW
jgi:hypothetical protein